jgi:hypothetical protein
MMTDVDQAAKAMKDNQTEAEIGDFAVSADVAQRISMPNFTRRLATA